MSTSSQAAAGHGAGLPGEGFVRRLLAGRRAVAAMEFALLLPVLLMLLFGMGETLRAVRAKVLLNSAVSAAAAIISTQTGAVTAPGCENHSSCAAGNLQDICQGALHVLQPLERPTFGLSIAAVTNADTTNPQSKPSAVAVVPLIQWEVYTACPNRGAAFPLAGAGTPAALTTPLIPYDNNVAVVVRGSFVYQPAFVYGVSGLFGQTTSGSVTLTSTLMVEPRSGALPCIVATTQLTCPPSD